MRLVGERRPGHSGLELHVTRFVDETATPSGTTILLLHGFLDRGSTWDDVAGPLAQRGHEVLAPDLRGFGQSEVVGRGGYYHFPDHVADVDTLVRDLAPARLCVVGHSMGGTVASLFAGARPDRVDRLVLVEGIGPPSMPPEQGMFRTRQWLVDLERARPARPLASLDEAVRRLAANHPRVPRAILERRANQLTTTTEAGLVWAHDPRHRTTSPIPFSASVLAGFLSEIRCPVLYVGGGEDGFHPEDEDARLACLRDLRRSDLPDAGHMIHWTQPDALANLVAAFIE